ncbi:hypothetical protein [Legionella brunensis]|uniref:Uncharacterized protein n=3 Tax=Legionella brunensis TaxID=29422 RepID=A0A0W0S190_9GAMM|nr:hypothetical protein [Legionella brunensis]KTC77067.1 hypothetical protein Lbru_3174 [Legionella brunensis]
MQFAEIRKAGFDEFRISVLLRKKGLKIFVIPNPTPEELYAYNPEIDKFVHMEDNRKYDVVPKGHFRGIQSGALVAYDEEAVASFLQDNIAIIEDENGEEPVEEYKWPMNPADFIDMVFRKNAKSKGMNILIHKIFQEMPERNRLYNLS